MALVPEEVSEVFDKLDSNIKEIEQQLAPFFEVPNQDLEESLSPLEKAKLSIIVAYAINTLFYSYLKTQGISPQDHPVKKELERIKLYIKKLQNVTELQKGPKSRIDREAADRFIARELNQNKNLDSAEASTSTDKTTYKTPDKSSKKGEDSAADITKLSGTKRKKPSTSEKSNNNNNNSTNNTTHTSSYSEKHSEAQNEKQTEKQTEKRKKSSNEEKPSKKNKNKN